jgi:hypothetical protein
MRCISLFLFGIVFSGLVSANDFPTFDRVDYVMACMKDHGGQTMDNMFSCSCAVDKIAQHMKFEEYSEATVFERYKKMPGEKGGIFRDSEHGDALIKRLQEARQEADKSCFVGRTSQR